MNCPICNHEKIEDGASHCPACDSDLSAFVSLNEVSSSKRRLIKINWLLISILILTLSIGGVSIYFQSSKNKTIAEKSSIRLEKNNAELKKMKKKIQKGQNKIKELEMALSLVKQELQNTKSDTPNINNDKTYSLHIVEEGETLWSIAERYYGNTVAVKKLLKQNNLAHPKFIKAGDPLVIKN